MTSLRRALAAGALAFLATGIASASTITQIFNLPAAGGQAPTNWTASANIQQFDSTVNGPLLAIRFTLSGDGRIDEDFIDRNDSARCPSGPDCGKDTVTVQAVADFHLKLGESNNPASLPVLDIESQTINHDFTGLSFGEGSGVHTDMTGLSVTTYDVANTSGQCAHPMAGCLENPFTVVNGSPFGINAMPVDPLDFSQFIGTGTLPLSVRAFVSRAVFGGGNGGDTFTGAANAVVQVDYIFGTPEPATFALFGSALIGLGFLRKRATK